MNPSSRDSVRSSLLMSSALVGGSVFEVTRGRSLYICVHEPQDEIVTSLFICKKTMHKNMIRDEKVKKGKNIKY